MSERVEALTQLLAALRERKYTFVTPTPASHARVVARESKQRAQDLRDIFGWSVPFERATLDAPLFDLLKAADLLEERGDLWRSLVRVSALHGHLFLHSAFPTTSHDAVFFGPDSYRFADFLHETLPPLAPRGHVVDIGAGSGVGAVVATHALLSLRATLTDINPLALELARANWAHANLAPADFVQCDALSGVDKPIDVIIANPPYIADPAHRAYRDGGALYGGAMSLTWAAEASRRLEKGGVFVMYTGTAVVNGEHVLRAPLLEALLDFDVLYGEIDPDVFGEELEREDYKDVERIAAIGAVAVKR